MPNPPPTPPSPDDERRRALHALQSMAKPQPKANPGPQPNPDPPPMSGASGFVGMLAKGQLGDPDALAHRPRYPLPVAREVTPPAKPSGASPAPAEPAPPRPQRPAAPPLLPTATAPEPPADVSRPATPSPSPPAPRPAWFTPLLLLFGIALLLVGLWAASALLYMNTAAVSAPEDVHFPLLRWEYDPTADTLVGGYTSASRVMAWSMLLALPLGGLITLLPFLLRRHARPA